MGKRIKQYKRLMRSFEFLGFRQPYQLLMTSDVIMDTLKVDLINLCEKALSTKNLKPMITQCCIRSLYERNKGPNRDPAIAAAIDRAKTFERRRCGHLMDQDPLTEQECMMSVVDPKGKGENKFRYVVATQDEELRERLRSVVPTPLMYVKRSVLILEPMSQKSQQVREREERAKYAEGILRRPIKRKREEDDESSDEHSGKEDGEGSEDEGAEGAQKKKKKRNYGPKGPNPLAVKKPKKATDGEKKTKPAAPTADTPTEAKSKRKRRKRTGAKAADGGEGGGEDTRGDKENGEVAAAAAAEE